jgi:2-polyprenyl-3-methyl-5-hydroxy-6-metoxy-1,4-benzoquinol methylase
MSIYDVNRARYGTHRLIADELGKNLVILDVGCNKGYLKSFADDSTTFYGLDFNEGDLEIANANGYTYIEKIDLNDYKKLKLRETFDVIIFADILEHVLHRNEVLKFFIENHLKENGRVIVSLPNVAHITIRLKLLFGDFTYTEAGILDKTHLHLFTLKSARDFITSCGQKIIREKFSSNRLGNIINLFPSLGSLLGYNIILVCKQ